MHAADPYYERLAKAVDLLDPREVPLALKFMIEALYRVTTQLPELTRGSAALANRFSTGAASLDELVAERVRLWTSIKGRDCSDEQDVLRTRAVICVLYPPGDTIAADVLEYFLMFWRRGGLGSLELEAAIFNNYGAI